MTARLELLELLVDQANQFGLHLDCMIIITSRNPDSSIDVQMQDLEFGNKYDTVWKLRHIKDNCFSLSEGDEETTFDGPPATLFRLMYI